MIYQYNATTPQLAQAFLNNYRRPAPARDRSEGIKNIFGSINDTLDENKRKDLINSFGPSKTAEEMAARERYINTGDLSNMQNYLTRVDNAAYVEAQSKAATESSNVAKRDELKKNISDLTTNAAKLNADLSTLAKDSPDAIAKQAEINANNDTLMATQKAYNELLGIDASNISIPTVTTDTTDTTVKTQDKIETKLINEATANNMPPTDIMTHNINDFDQSAKAAANDKVAKHLTTTVGYDKAPSSHEEASKRTTLKTQLANNGFDKAVTDKINTKYVTKEELNAKANTDNQNKFKNDLQDYYANNSAPSLHIKGGRYKQAFNLLYSVNTVGMDDKTKTKLVNEFIESKKGK